LAVKEAPAAATNCGGTLRVAETLPAQEIHPISAVCGTRKTPRGESHPLSSTANGRPNAISSITGECSHPPHDLDRVSVAGENHSNKNLMNRMEKRKKGGRKQGRSLVWRRMMFGWTLKSTMKNDPWYSTAVVHIVPDDESGSLVTTSHETIGSSNPLDQSGTTLTTSLSAATTALDGSRRGGTMHMTFFVEGKGT
jgi:hypothetical protein